MDRYLDQFIEDLQAKHKPKVDPMPSVFDLDEESDDLFADVERYLSGGHEQRLGDVLDLFPEQFPPVDQLTPPQLLRLVQAYDALLHSWHVGTDIPEGLSIDTAYRLLVTTLDREVYLSDEGFVTIEFCTYDSENCPYAQVCRCDEEYEELQKSIKWNNEEDDIPF